MIKELNILRDHGKQYIPSLQEAELLPPFRGKPEITEKQVNLDKLVATCPTGAITGSPFQLDLGKCAFCGECAQAFPEKVVFTSDHRMATNDRRKLIVHEGEPKKIQVVPNLIRKEVIRMFGRSLKLRQVCAGGDNSTGKELAACGNVNFDMGRYGIEFVASPRHSDGIVISGPITQAMARPLELCYEAVPDPKIVILAGTDAISGGIFADSPAIDRSFLDKVPVDLYVPGNPPHPLTFILGVLSLIQSKSNR